MLFIGNGVNGIAQCGTAALQGDGHDGDQADDEQGREEDPYWHGALVGEAGYPAADDDHGYGYGHYEADGGDDQVVAVEHREDFAHRCAVYSAQRNLLAAELGLEVDEAEDTDDGYQQGDECCGSDQTAQVVLFLVEPSDGLVHEVQAHGGGVEGRVKLAAFLAGAGS